MFKYFKCVCVCVCFFFFCDVSSGVQCALVVVTCSQLMDLWRKYWSILTSKSTSYVLLVSDFPVAQRKDAVFKKKYCPIRNADRTRISEENELIWRDVPLPVTSDLAFKVDVSITNWNGCSFQLCECIFGPKRNGRSLWHTVRVNLSICHTYYVNMYNVGGTKLHKMPIST